MFEYVFLTILFVAALLGAIAFSFGTVGGLQWARRFPNGVLHCYFYAVFFSNGLSILVSTRNFSLTGETFDPASSGGPLVVWMIRFTSAIAMLGAVDQILRHFRVNERSSWERVLLIFSLVAFWVLSLVVPSLLAAHDAGLQLSWVYSLVLGAGLIFVSKNAAQASVIACRNAIIAFCFVSLMLIPVSPDLVLQTNYTQGYIPGVPRFAGLSPHAGVIGLNASLALWCLFAYPIERKWLHWCSIVVLSISLFLAQSKAVWIAFVVVTPMMIVFQRGLPSFNGIASSRYGGSLAGFLLVVMMFIALSGAALMFGDVGSRLDKFFASDQGAQLLSITGRDRIWAVALDEWARSPIFGYGLPLFGPEHRAQIGMWYATSGHNQFIDALGRTGLLGTVSVVFYMLVLLVVGLKFGGFTRGLSAVLAVSIWIRTVSELPISLTTIGIDTIPYYLLLAVLASQLSNTARQAKVTVNG